MTFTPFPTAFFRWDEEERAAMARVIGSNRFTMGPEVAAFEEEVAAYHGRKYGLMVNSGSSANLLAVAALFYLANRPLQRGDTAVVPALAWSTTYAPLIQYGLQLQLADIDDTWNAPPALSITMVPRRPIPRLIVVASILGNPAYLEGWEKLARDAGAYLIEDNCESIGARTVDGKLTGTAGIASTLSFFWSHQLGAIEGGMVLTDDEEVITICRMLRDHGLTRTLPGAPAGYDFQLFGYNLRPMETHAAVGRAQLAKLPEFMAARSENQHYFVRRVWSAGLPLRFPVPRGDVSPFGVAFEVDPEKRPLLDTALKEVGIDSRPPTGGSFLRHAYGAPWRDQRTPRADAVHDAGMFIGNPPYCVTEPYDRAVEVMKKVLL